MKILLSIPIVLIAAIYIGLGTFVGFFAKTSFIFGILFILAGLAPLAMIYRPELLQSQRRRNLWILGLLYGAIHLLGSFIGGVGFIAIVLGLTAGGICVLCIRKVVPPSAAT